MIGSGIALIVIAGIAYYKSGTQNNLKEKSRPTGIKKPCFGDWVFMRQNKIQWPYGGFEITYFRAPFLFQRCSCDQEAVFGRIPPCQFRYS